MSEDIVYTTKSGKVLTSADIETLVAEAEAGYDVSQLRPKDPSEGIPSWWRPLTYVTDKGVTTTTPITVSRAQLRAVCHAICVVDAVREAEGYEWGALGASAAKGVSLQADLDHSALLERLAVQGLPPHLKAPPIEYGYPAWHKVPGDPNYREGA